MTERIAILVASMTLCACTVSDAAGTGTGSESGTAAASGTDTSASTANPTTAAPDASSAAPTSAGPSDDTAATSVADGTGSGTSASAESSGTTGGGAPGPDVREPGPHPVDTGAGSFATSCTMQYDVYSPSDVEDPPQVILAHGFQGSKGSMVGWATHWASWGVEVVAPNLCHATIIDADHAQNGADLIALADGLGIDAPIYAGYSAGGLAAVVAAAGDPSTVAIVGLDMVDANGIGADNAAGVTVPAHDVVGESVMCNSSANGVPVFGAMADADVLRVTEADHCDFQDPGDLTCGFCSLPNTTFDTEEIQATIRGLTTSAILWRTGLDATGAQWWTAGEGYYDELFAAGAISQL